MLQKGLVSITILLLVLSTFVDGYSERYRHMEFIKKTKEDDYVPIFHTNKIYTMIYSTPQICVKPLYVRRKVNRNANNFIGDFSPHIGFAYLDNGLEVRRWQRAVGGDNENHDPWYAMFTCLLLALGIIVHCAVSAIVAPIIAIILFHILRVLWFLIANEKVRSFIRRIWIENEVRKRKHTLVIYMWENRRKPKIRARLPYFLRNHKNEDIPEELLELIPPSSSPLSSNGMDLEYFYAEFEEDTRDAQEAQKLRMEAELAEALNPTPTALRKAKRREKGIPLGQDSWSGVKKPVIKGIPGQDSWRGVKKAVGKGITPTTAFSTLSKQTQLTTKAVNKPGV